MTFPVPSSAHNEALAGDILYSVSLNFEWRKLIVPLVISGLEALAATIEDESDLQDFETLYGALIDDLYDEDIVDNNPVGLIIAHVSNTPPTTKYLLCNGQTVAQDDYPELYALIGNFYTVPPIADMFKVPNLQVKIIRGADSGVNTPGTGVGADTHTLTEAQIPSHTHTIAHTHNLATATAVGTTATRVADGGGVAGTTVPTLGVNTPDSGATGGGGSHNNIPASVHMAYMIKALP